ncbi:hypothetical protein VTJ49DRAFT_378 [Mycothermus thermophilus]|uniref:Myb-like domain-containing protein n=1 Tax=Humicola insolens TaxID=85995 RepID=A0ABR3VR59_HUMIN
MLNKKSAFKPKAAVRRPGPSAPSQPSQRPSTTDRSTATTPTPTPRESSSQSQQPAPQCGPSEKDVAATSQVHHEKQVESAPTVQPRQVSLVSGSAVASTEGTGGITTTQPTGAPRTESPSVEPERVSAQPVTEAQIPAESQPPVVEPTVQISTANDQAKDSSKQVEAPRLTEIPATTEATDVAPAPVPIQAPAPTTDTVRADRPPVAEPATPTPESGASTESEPSQPPVESGTQPAKPKRVRKRAAPAASAEESGEQSTGAAPTRRPRKKAAPTPSEEGQQPAALKKAARTRKRTSTEGNEDGEQNGEGNVERPKKRRPPRTQRQPTPPDAEHVEIDITKVKMADLAKDMHIGKKFSLHDELMQREREKRMRYNERRKRMQAGEDPDGAATGETSASTPTDPSGGARSTPQSGAEAISAKTPATEGEPAEEEDDENRTSRAPIGETYQIINGQIVLDHRSLQVDRHARAREEADRLVEVEENDFTHHTTTATYLRRNLKPQQWTDDETELFYKALAAFGTDFDTICRMFKGKTRKHIKLKFNREERVNPARVNAALVGEKKVAIDIQQYQRATGQEYESTEAIYAEQRRAEEEFEARQKALEDEQAEELRRRKEEVLASLSSAADGGKQGRGKGRKKKAPAVVGL